MNIYLIRHGQDEDNANGILNGGRRDMPLTQVGEQQAQDLADKINELGLEFDAVYTSPLQRSVQTAGIVFISTKIPAPIKMEGLIERDFGVMTGRKVSDIKPFCSPDILETEKVTYFLSPEGAETFPELLKRAQGVVDSLKEKNHENILIVTHGDIGKMIYAAFQSLDWKVALGHFHFANGELILLSN